MKRLWFDLSRIGVYLSVEKMADGEQRIVLLDMEGRGDPAKLREIGFQPVAGSSRYDKDIYFLQGNVTSKALAPAFGLVKCPVVEVESSEVTAVFREKITEKFAANINAVIGRSRPLGQNRAGQYVYESPAGRFIRMSSAMAVSEGSVQAERLGQTAFLRASNDEELRACAEGFLWTIRQGGKTAWPDLVRFAKTVYGEQAEGGEPSGEQMHRMQEALEAASYRHFTVVASQPDDAAFKLGTDVYYGLPSARMRTAESVFLQQYSTPLPMSVIAQRLLLGNDDPAGKTVLEPTAGNGGLVNLLPESVRIHAVELDVKRFEALRETGRIEARLGDAVSTPFRTAFGVEEGFDYVIANPPFGQMDEARAFEQIPGVRRLDHYIPLQTLAARKDQGRTVLIFGADSAQSDGTVRGGAKHFLNWIHDHYEVLGLTEIDGRMYARNGAGYNVRMMVIGDKRPEPVQAEVPEKLPIVTSYDDLWRWADHAIENYNAPKPAPVKDNAEPVIDVFDTFDAAAPVFGAGEAAMVVREVAPEPTPSPEWSTDWPPVYLRREVSSRVSLAVSDLHAVRRELADQKQVLDGQSFSLALRDWQEEITKLQVQLAEIRELAPQYGVDPEEIIEEMGGEPDFSEFGDPAPADPVATPIETPAAEPAQAVIQQLAADGTVLGTGEIRLTNSLPSRAVIQDDTGNLYIVTRNGGGSDAIGLLRTLDGVPFTPGERPDFVFPAGLVLLPERKGNEGLEPDMRGGPFFFTGLCYEDDWEDVAKYRPADLQQATVAPEASPAADEFARARTLEQRDVVLQRVQALVPQAESFESTYGRSQWVGRIKHLIGSDDYLKVFVKDEVVGDMAKIKVALAKAGSAKDLIAITDTLREMASASTPDNPPAQRQGQTDAEPWQITLQAWNSEIEANRAGSGIGTMTRNVGSQAAAQAERLEFLRYGVTDWAREKLQAAQRGEITLTQDELGEITDRLETSVTHRDVIDKALGEGKPVPQAVLADYPDLSGPAERHVNEFQTPYQPASAIGEASAMVPINMAGSTYAALNDLESNHGRIDAYVADRLQYDEAELGRYFSPEQVDALGLAIRSVEEGRGIINADQTGMGKGRFVAAMLRYAKLNDKTPIFLTVKPELFTDIFRDVSDIGSQHLFKKLFIFNDGKDVMQYGTEDKVLYPRTSQREMKAVLASGELEPGTDMVLATYSQFARPGRKVDLLTGIAANNGMLILDESHIAAGASHIGEAVGQAVANSSAVLYASATPLKGVSNFAIYSRVFPASVDLESLPETLKTGGEALQEAISANMARDGVLIRREHDFSKLVFHTRNPNPERVERNIKLADTVAEILGEMAYLSGDVETQISKMNKQFKQEWEEIPAQDRAGQRMQASSMNFGSRLYSLNRQFLLGIKIDDCIDSALDALANGRKPVIAVENTGESLLRQVVARRTGMDRLVAELEELDEARELSAEDKERRAKLVENIENTMRNAVLDNPPQYRELLESMLDRINNIKIKGRYGEVTEQKPESAEYWIKEEALREKIKNFPDLPLTPIDIIKKELQQCGHPVAEVSGRTMSIAPTTGNSGQWSVSQHPKTDAVANVAGFQNGKYDAIVITRAGSTGISLHATDRFEDSDIRQRDFIVLQKAANIAEFLQWMGRVNRKDQVMTPVVTGLESGLPAELRLTMMHNAKLRKLSANTTSNRENANLEGEDLDLLNEVGDQVALRWLVENPDIASILDIRLPDGEEEGWGNTQQECPYINKLMGRLMLLDVDRQEEILKTLADRFTEKLDELEQMGVNPFKVDVYDWQAKIVKEEELHSGVIRAAQSTFDQPVMLATVRYEQIVHPIRSEKLQAMVKTGSELFRENPLVEEGSLWKFKQDIKDMRIGWLREQLPSKLRNSEEKLTTLLEDKDAIGAKSAKERSDWLINNIEAFRPGTGLTHDDPFKGERRGVITSVQLPGVKEDDFMLSKYRAKVVFPGEERPQEITLATVRSQGHTLSVRDSIDPAITALGYYQRREGEKVLAAFDDAPEGKVVCTRYVLRGNIFRACELASTQNLGSPILFTDENGNRQRGVRIKDRITPEMVKAMPIGLDAQDMSDYINEFLDPKHPDYQQRAIYHGLNIYNQAVKEMTLGGGIEITTMNGGKSFRLTMPGSKARAGRLMTDGRIFDIGEKTTDDSLQLQLTGTKSYMQAMVGREDLPLLLERLQQGKHVGKFYLPSPDQEIIKTLKERYRNENGKELEVEEVASAM